MRTITTAILLAAAVASPRLVAAATVTGGGPTTSDCYNGFEVTSDNPGFTSDAKSASANACGGSCTFQVSACVGLSEPAGCTATTLKPAQDRPLPRRPASARRILRRRLVVGQDEERNGKKKGVKKFKMKGRGFGEAEERPRQAEAHLQPESDRTRCGTTTSGHPVCAANPDGGPKELVLTIGQSGTDLDNGWTGSSHNFILVPNGKLDGCLSNCNSGSDTLCDFNAGTARHAQRAPRSARRSRSSRATYRSASSASGPTTSRAPRTRHGRHQPERPPDLRGVPDRRLLGLPAVQERQVQQRPELREGLHGRRGLSSRCSSRRATSTSTTSRPTARRRHRRPRR
jgi:hypothetical protein